MKFFKIAQSVRAYWITDTGELINVTFGNHYETFITRVQNDDQLFERCKDITPNIESPEDMMLDYNGTIQCALKLGWMRVHASRNALEFECKKMTSGAFRQARQLVLEKRPRVLYINSEMAHDINQMGRMISASKIWHEILLG